MILNIILPTWMFFIFLPGLMLFAIVFNFIVDATIYHIVLRGVSFKWDNIWKFIVKGYLFGFLADLAGVAIIGLMLGNSHSAIFYVYLNVWTSAVHIIAVLVSGYLVYKFTFLNFKDSGVDPYVVKKLAIWMALLTMPYTFLIPGALFYS